MNGWLWSLVGAVVVAPIWVALTIWGCRRLWRNARRLSARAKGHEQLVELGQLVGGLAHEIKNPLSTVNLNLKLLAEDLHRINDDEHRRMLRRLESVRDEVDRVKATLDDFLRFAGKMELTLVSVDMRRLVEELSDFFLPQAEAEHVILRTALPSEPLNCKVDANLLKQALLNLMLNALHATSSGGELLLKISRQSDRCVVEVIDTGSGIAPDKLERIFDVYYSGKKQGSGLGLPTTRRIIREHGGTIRVESETGKGTRFVISLPAE